MSGGAACSSVAAVMAGKLRRLQWAAGAGALMLSQQAVAGDWQWTQRLSIRETYTDNVNLDSLNPREEFVTQVTPGFSLRGTGARVRSSIDYNMQFVLPNDGDEDNRTNHQLQGNSNVTLVRDYLFFDAQSTISQQLNDARGRISNTNISAIANRGDVTTFRFSPYATFGIGDFARAILRYAYSEVTNEVGASDFGAGASDSSADTYTVNVDSAEFFGPFQWNLNFNRREDTRETNVEANENVTFQRFNARLSYDLNRKYTVFVTFGEEDNEFETNFNSSGSTWSVGGRWTPNSRTSLSADWGERFFGNTKNVTASYRKRRIAFQATYREEVRTINQVQEDIQPILLVDEFGNEVFNPEDSADFPLQEDSPSLTDEVFVDKRLNGSVAYIGQRAQARLSFSDSTQDFQETGASDGQTRIQMNINYPLSRQLRAGFVVSWQENTFGEGDSDTIVRASPSLIYEISRLMTSRLSYSYNEQDSDDLNRAFTENRVEASLTFRF